MNNKKTFEAEIIFHSSSSPKNIKNIKSLYTKGQLLCIQLEDGLIIKYPLINIFSICHKHGKHLGSNQNE